MLAIITFFCPTFLLLSFCVPSWRIFVLPVHHVKHPFVHIREVTWYALHSLPHFRACLRVHWHQTVVLVYMQPTTHSITRGDETHAAFTAVTLDVDGFVSGFDLDPNEHTRHTF